MSANRGEALLWASMFRLYVGQIRLLRDSGIRLYQHGLSQSLAIHGKPHVVLTGLHGGTATSAATTTSAATATPTAATGRGCLGAARRSAGVHYSRSLRAAPESTAATARGRAECETMHAGGR